MVESKEGAERILWRFKTLRMASGLLWENHGRNGLLQKDWGGRCSTALEKVVLGKAEVISLASFPSTT